MDQNKLAKLDEIDYRIPALCALCAHGRFVGTDDWGVCTKFTYVHQKHTGEPRELSITRFGSCSEWDPTLVETDKLGVYRVFMQPPASKKGA